MTKMLCLKPDPDWMRPISARAVGRGVIPGGRRIALATVAVSVGLLLAGCSAHSNAPSIGFTKVPPAALGDSIRVEPIEGRVTGARPGQKIVLYARAGPWWIQPVVERPLTEIRADSTWSSNTHPGTEYAALLVDPDYRPLLKTDELPGPGGGVVAVASTAGAKTPSWDQKTIEFSGYEWEVRNNSSDRNGSTFSYLPANVSVDPAGLLHLRIARHAETWTCSEVGLKQNFGYGTYRFTVQDVGHLEPAVVLSMLTWDDMHTDQNHREMDVEISRWGDVGNKNAQYVIQPFYIPVNVNRFAAPSGPLTYSFTWAAGNVSFETVTAGSAGAHVIARHEFTSGIPTPEAEAVHINFCAFGSAKAPLQHEAEVVIERFQYLP